MPAGSAVRSVFFWNGAISAWAFFRMKLGDAPNASEAASAP